MATADNERERAIRERLAAAICIEGVDTYTYWGNEPISGDPPVAIVLSIEVELNGETHSFSTGLDYRHYDDPNAVVGALNGKRFIHAQPLLDHVTALEARVDELTRDLAATREALRPFAERYHEANEHNGRRSPIDPDRGYFVAYKHLKQAAALASARDRGDDADGEAEA